MNFLLRLPLKHVVLKLYRSHQKEAVDFISRREGGEMPEEQSLWKYNETDEDEPL